jgi:hypothetical protein
MEPRIETTLGLRAIHETIQPRADFSAPLESLRRMAQGELDEIGWWQFAEDVAFDLVADLRQRFGA